MCYFIKFVSVVILTLYGRCLYSLLLIYMDLQKCNNFLYLCPKSLYSVASTLANGMGGSFSFRDFAALEYSGANDLQCPHLKYMHQPQDFKLRCFVITE